MDHQIKFQKIYHSVVWSNLTIDEQLVILEFFMENLKLNYNHTFFFNSVREKYPLHFLDYTVFFFQYIFAFKHGITEFEPNNFLYPTLSQQVGFVYKSEIMPYKFDLFVSLLLNSLILNMSNREISFIILGLLGEDLTIEFFWPYFESDSLNFLLGFYFIYKKRRLPDPEIEPTHLKKPKKPKSPKLV